MKYFYALLSFCLIFSFAAKAQSNFKPGYIVDNKKDTIRGFIDYREWVRNPVQVTFRRDMNQPDEKVTTDNANGFGVTGAEYYYKATVRISTSSLQATAMTTGIDTSYTVNTVFLKTLVKGKTISLYVYSNDVKTGYYIINESNSEITALNKYAYLNQDKIYVTVNSYINQLLGLALQYKPGDEKLQQTIKKSGYNAAELSDIVATLNGQSEIKQAFNTSAGTRFFVGLTVKNNRISFNPPNPLFVDRSTSAIVPELSAGVDIIPNRNTGVLVFRIEVTASQGSFSISDPPSDNAVSFHSLKFKQTTLSLTPQILYNIYSTDNLKIYLDGGFALNTYHYNKHYYISKFSNGTENVKEDFPKFKPFQISFPIYAGIEIAKKFQVFAGYTIPSVVIDDGFRTSRISSVNAGLKYLLR